MKSRSEGLASTLFLMTLLVGVFLGLLALLAWPIGRLGIILPMAKGFAAFGGLSLVLAFVPALVLGGLLRLFGLRDDSGAGESIHLVLHILLSASLSLFWAAFTARTLTGTTAGLAIWAVGLLHVGSFLATYLGFALVSELFPGTIYRTIALRVTIGSFLLFALWPSGARLLMGWAH